MNILITGGASGLGEAITKALAKEQRNTVYFTFNRSATNATAISRQFSNTVPLHCDFKNDATVNDLCDQIDGYDLDVLVNNAYTGDPVKTYFHKIPVGDFYDDFSHNVLPTITLTQAAIKNFRKKKSGKIITILTSFMVNVPPAGSSVYVANKAYLSSLVKSWASENSKFNISSNSISPSFMLSQLTKDVDERIIEKMIDDHPLKRLLTAGEVADSVDFLVNASAQINGVNLVINSGTDMR